MAGFHARIGCRAVWAPLLCLALVLLVAARVGAEEKPGVREVLAGTVLAKKAKEVARGKKVTVQAHEASKREMAVALACLIPAGRRGSLAQHPVAQGRATHPFLGRPAPGRIEQQQGQHDAGAQAEHASEHGRAVTRLRRSESSGAREEIA
jgi:hypothetical protein